MKSDEDWSSEGPEDWSDATAESPSGVAYSGEMPRHEQALATYQKPTGLFDAIRQAKARAAEVQTATGARPSVTGKLWTGMIPESPGQALTALLMGAYGRVPGAIGMGQVPAALSRIGIGAAAGGAGAAADKGDVGKSAVAGGAITAGVETAFPAISKLIRSLPGMKGHITNLDAQKVLDWIRSHTGYEETAGVTASEKLYNATRRPGFSDYMQQKMQEVGTTIDRMIGGQRISVPSLSDQPMTLSAAWKEIGKLGEKGYGGALANKIGRPPTREEIRALRTQALNEVESALGAIESPTMPTQRGLALPAAGETGVSGPAGRFAVTTERPPVVSQPSGVRERTSYGPEQYEIPRGGQQLETRYGDPYMTPREVRSVGNPVQQTRRSNEMRTQLETGYERANTIPSGEVPIESTSTPLPGSRRVAIVDGRTGRVIGYGQEGPGGIAQDITPGAGMPIAPQEPRSTPTALDVFRTGREVYGRGATALDLFGSGNKFRNGPQLNTPAVQKELSEEITQYVARTHGASEELWDMLGRGAPIGKYDVLASGRGGFGDALMEWLRGRNTGATQTLRVPVTTFLPNIGSQYVGTAPYTAPQGVRSLVDILALYNAPQIADTSARAGSASVDATVNAGRASADALRYLLGGRP